MDGRAPAQGGVGHRRGAQVIDANGAFLIPGLWDMHVHATNDEEDIPAFFPLFIANGVTGIRDMWGNLKGAAEAQATWDHIAHSPSCSIDKARRLMADNRIDAIYLESGTSLFYFTGVRWGASERMFGAVLPARGDMAWISPKFEEGRARELIKFGTDIRKSQLNDKADNYSRGYWAFNRVCGGTTYATAYAAMLDGCIASFQKAWGPFYLENRINESNFYAEDQRRLAQSLTATLGLRYEYVSAPREIKSRIDYGFKADKNNVEPRISAAWTIPNAASGVLKLLTGDQEGDAVIRGGYGRKDGRLFQSVLLQEYAAQRYI